MAIVIYFALLSLQIVLLNMTMRDRFKTLTKKVEMFRPNKIVNGCELIFISRIHKEGYGVEVVSNHKMQDLYATDCFSLNCISISKGTYIASGMSTFVVKLKPKEL